MVIDVHSLLCGQPMSRTLSFDENDYQATHSKRKKKTFRENKEILYYSTEDFQKTLKPGKMESVLTSKKKDLETIFVNKYKLKYSTMIG